MEKSKLLELDSAVTTALCSIERADAILTQITYLVFQDEDYDLMRRHFRECYLLHTSALEYLHEAEKVLDEVEV